MQREEISEVFAELRLFRRRRDVLGADTSPVVLPQRADELGDRDRVGVVADQSHHEHAVLAQVVLDELDGPRAVLAGVQSVHEAQVLLHVAVPVDAERHAQRPHQQRAGRRRRHERHPEPDEQEDLLVEEVDRQDALDRVALDVGQPADAEVAERHAREPRRRRPVASGDHGPQHVDAEQVEVLAEEDVEREQLADDVDEEQQLDGQVAGCQVVAVTTTAAAETGARETVLETDVT